MAIIKPNNNTISAITALPAGVGGKVLQVQQVSTSTQTAINGTTWTDIGGLELTITPIISSSKFFITCVCTICPNNLQNLTTYTSW